MTEGDLDAVMEIENASFPQPWSRELMARELSNPISYPFVKTKSLKDGSEVLVGYLIFWLVYGEAHILNIAVRSDLQGSGIGSRLLSFALDFMSKRGVDLISLEVRKSNTTAISIYNRFGFEEVYVRKLYYGDEDAVVMSLNLGVKLEE
ncbi:MAG: ribosomal protein S18-alanine N-acetyltransferase [Deltaproteobacteria bacterium]|nr:ribosomal protein S18-alanine N-acetyltransferase [Deltaproteobacteria bacterium]